jgi:hypothetical protein
MLTDGAGMQTGLHFGLPHTPYAQILSQKKHGLLHPLTASTISGTKKLFNMIWPTGLSDSLIYPFRSSSQHRRPLN